MSEHREPIPSMLYNAAVGGHVTNSQQIIDENLNREQQDINEEVVAVPYNATTPNGMGKIVLKKNDNFKQVVEAQTDGNTIFVIKYDFTLTGDVTVPANCVLEFDGGSISGDGTDKDTITGNNTIIAYKSYDILKSINVAGTFSNDSVDIDIFDDADWGIKMTKSEKVSVNMYMRPITYSCNTTYYIANSHANIHGNNAKIDVYSTDFIRTPHGHGKEGILIENLIATSKNPGTGTGIFFDGGDPNPDGSTPAGNKQVRNANLLYVTLYSFHVAFRGRMWRHSSAINCVFEGCDIGYWHDGCSMEVSIKGCLIAGSEAGIYVYNEQTNSRPEGLYIDGCSIFGQDNPIYMAHPMQDLSIMNCWIESKTKAYGVAVNLSARNTECVANNIRIVGCGLSGKTIIGKQGGTTTVESTIISACNIFVGASNRAFSFYKCTRVNISNCTIFNIDQTGDNRASMDNDNLAYNINMSDCQFYGFQMAWNVSRTTLTVQTGNFNNLWYDTNVSWYIYGTDLKFKNCTGKEDSGLDSLYGVCSTESSNPAKELTLSNFSLKRGGIISVLFNNAITTSNNTLNINNAGAKNININGYSMSPNVIKAGTTAVLQYDGTNFNVISYDRYNNPNIDSDAVDLGLPSGLLWCKHNVGATNPEDNGLYFAWGETVGYADGNARNAASGVGGRNGFSLQAYQASGGTSISANLTLSQDGARATMGGDWRMPSNDEVKELIYNCYWEEATVNGKDGILFTSKHNGNTLFIPSAGRYNQLQLYSMFAYWDTSYFNSDRAWELVYAPPYVNSPDISADNRFVGQPIRAVK